MNQSRSGGGEDTVADDLAIMGAPADVIEQFKQEQSEDDAFGIFPENWVAFGLFMQLDTQWRTRLMPFGQGFISRSSGIDYTALESLMRMLRIKKVKDTFERIRIMETAALEAMDQT